MKSISSDFLSTALRAPESTFLIDRDDEELSYRQVLLRATGFRNQLEQRGVKPGDRVVLTAPNSASYISAYLGTLLHGAIASLVDYKSPRSHLEFVIRDTGAQVWASPEPTGPEIEKAQHLSTQSGLGQEPLNGPDEVMTAPSGDALIIYTSGTTGRPKGVRLTHDNLRHSIRAIADWAEIQADNREFTTLSLTHLFGLAHVHIHWTLGGSVVIDEGLQDPNAVLSRMKRWSPTSFPATPAGLRLLLHSYPDEFAEAGAGLRHVIINSAPMRPDDTRLLMKLLPHTRCYMYYGLTEASRSTWILYNRHVDKLETVGRPSRGCELKIEPRDESSVEGEGEILLRGPHVSPGYWGDSPEDDTGSGWFATGDLGRQDSDGFVTWVGRLREQINVDGLKVAPREVEDVLREHPDVEDCVVVGCPDEIYGEVVVAFVVTRAPDPDSIELNLRRHCRDRLERHKIPRRIGVIDRVPATASGKVQRMQLRERARQLR